MNFDLLCLQDEESKMNFWWISPPVLRYNTLMKLVFLGASFSTVYLMRFDKVIKVTYDRESDTFKHVFLIVPCLVLAVIFHNEGLLEVGGRWGLQERWHG
jgi:hypothetical protein